MPPSDAAIQALYQTVLHERRVLLFFDDARDASQVERLLPHEGSCLLITSRQRMVLPGGRLHVVNTLSPLDSQALLRKLVERVGNSAAEIAELCGFLPLAIRLAGTALLQRVDLSVDQYICRLREERTRRELIDATIELSYNLLSPGSQQIWRILSTFSGPFDSKAAASVLNRSVRSSTDGLGDLLKHSMIDWDAALSLYSFHDLLRLVADARLTGAERDEARFRHASHYEKHLRTLKGVYRQGGTASLTALQQYDGERPQVEAAMAWVRAHIDQARYRRLCSCYLDAGVDIFPIRLTSQELVAWLQDAVKAARALNHNAAMVTHMGNLGVALHRAQDYESAKRVLNEALQMNRARGDVAGITTGLGNLANVYFQLGDHAKCIELATESLSIEEHRGNRKGMAADLNTLGNVYTEKRNYEQAIIMYARSLQLKRELGDRLGEAVSYASVGRMYLKANEPQRALPHLYKAVAGFRRLGDKAGEKEAREILCTAMLTTGLIAGLTEQQAKALRTNRPETALALAEQVIQSLTERATEARKVGKDLQYAAIVGDIASLRSAFGQDELAVDMHRESINAARKCGAAHVEANSHFNIAACLARLGRTNEAIDAMEHARIIYEKLGLPDVKDAETQLTLMKCGSQMNDPADV